MQSRNRMCGEQLVMREGAPIQIFQNPRTGRIGFVCGNISGRCTHRLANKIANHEVLSINDLEYCERVYPNTTIPELGLSSNATILMTIR